MRPTALIAALALVSLAAAAHAGERVKLKNGNVLEGTIESRTQTELILRTPTGVVRLGAGDVVSVETVKDRPKKAPAEAQASAKPDETDAAQEEPEADPDAPSERLIERIVKRLGDKSVRERAIASDWVMNNWPESRAVLERALDGRVEAARMAAVHLLGREELGDTSELLKKAVGNPSSKVRVFASRIIWQGEYRHLEPELVLRVMLNDPEWAVRLEALRGLKSIGTMRCAKVVLYSFRTSNKPRYRKRCLRVLRRVTGQSHGENVRAWENAINHLLKVGGGIQPEPPPAPPAPEPKPKPAPKPVPAPAAEPPVDPVVADEGKRS
jgi:hypothetical protein